MKNTKKFMIGAYSIGLTAVVVAVVIALNLFVSQLPATFTKLDASAEKVLTIGADTKKVLKGIKNDITIYHLFSEGQENPDVAGILERYEAASSRIKVKSVDPTKDPTFIKKYTDASISQNSLIVVSEKRSTVIDGAAFVKYEIEGYEGQFITAAEYQNYAQQMAYYGQNVSATAYFFGENEITGAVDYVSHDNLPVIYELSGHGEVSLSSGTYGTLIADENVELKSLELLKGEKAEVPSDAQILIINAPQSDLNEAEKDAILSYINGGGKVMYLSYFEFHTKDKMPNMWALCNKMGLEAIPSLIVESNEEGYYQYPYYLLPKSTGKGMTAGVDASNLYLFMTASHAIKSAGENKNVSIEPLFETTKGAYIYTEESAKDPSKAKKQTFTLAYQSTAVDKDGNAAGTFYWYATPEFLSEAFKDSGNGQLFIKFLTENCEKPTSVSVIGKPITQSYLQLTENVSFIWTVVMVGVIPLAVIVAGFIVWYRRRSR